ncbi:hypothetical protein L596_023000 [Steinernema carpocapsae]|uniref:G-protein coupled receptors family 1 profile domain-containing protein n=1 Tax=Steinernema carpocapsae TaxID=34508 RepID=A0A4U5MCD2_STECR|nr:hypothetical protein L596_023000 [Steinernema carpocapsae]
MGQLTMIIINIFIQLICAVCMAIYSTHILYAFGSPNQELMFWSGTSAFSMLAATVVAELFLSADRFLAISSPLAYARRIKGIVLGCILSCLVTFISAVGFAITQRLPEVSHATTFYQLVEARWMVTSTSSALTLCFCTVLATVVVVVKIRSYNKQLRARNVVVSGTRSDTVKVNPAD